VKNWLHNDSDSICYYYLDSLLGPMTAKVFRAPDSICEDVRSQKSGTVGDKRQHERVAEVPRCVMNVDGFSRNDTSKFLARQVLGMHLPKFSGNVKEWPTFITTFRRTTFDCGFSDS
jgi:hypothetical protein